jgi:hypothetical protein
MSFNKITLYLISYNYKKSYESKFSCPPLQQQLVVTADISFTHKFSTSHSNANISIRIVIVLTQHTIFR